MATVSDDRWVRKARTWLVVGLVGLMVAGCSNSGQSTQGKPTMETQPGGPIGAIPGAMPMRLCTNNIFSGSNLTAVVHTSDDIVVGPLRFSTLRQATQPNQYSFHTPDGLAYGIKIPLTVSGTASAWIALRLSSDYQRVKVSYDPASFLSGSPGDPKHGSDSVSIQSAVACGLGTQGFVQYNGGFTWLHASCATVQVFDQDGRLLGSKRIPFGVKHCS